MVKLYLVHVTGGPSLGNGKLHRNILALVVAPAPRSVVTGPVVVQTMVQSRLVVLVAIVTSSHALNCLVGVTSLVAQVPRQKGVGGSGHAWINHPIHKRGLDPRGYQLEMFLVFGEHSLIPDRLAVGIDLHIWIIEATDTGHGAEVLPEPRRLAFTFGCPSLVVAIKVYYKRSLGIDLPCPRRGSPA